MSIAQPERWARAIKPRMLTLRRTIALKASYKFTPLAAEPAFKIFLKIVVNQQKNDPNTIKPSLGM